MNKKHVTIDIMDADAEDHVPAIMEFVMGLGLPYTIAVRNQE